MALILFSTIASADIGYNVYNSSSMCGHYGTGAGGKNGLSYGNIGYGGCWVNDLESGIVFMPCNPFSLYTGDESSYDRLVLVKPFFEGINIATNNSWNCYGWVGQDVNYVEDVYGVGYLGRACDPTKISVLSAGDITPGDTNTDLIGAVQFYDDCEFAGGSTCSPSNYSCAPIDCSPLSISEQTNIDYSTITLEEQRRGYFCEDYLVTFATPPSTLKLMSEAGSEYMDTIKETRGIDISPKSWTIVWDQVTQTKIMELEWWGLTTGEKIFSTPSNIDYELSVICTSPDQTGTKTTYQSFFESGKYFTFIADWYPVRIEVPNFDVVPSEYSQSFVFESAQYIATGSANTMQGIHQSTSPTNERNICINRADMLTGGIEGLKTFIANPGDLRGFADILPQWLKDSIQLFAILIDLILVGIVGWFLFNVYSAFLELRVQMYARKPLLMVIPGVSFMFWIFTSAIAYTILLENEFASKVALSVILFQQLLGIAMGFNIETAIISLLSYNVGFLPASLFIAAVIVAVTIMLLIMFILFYDIYTIYIRPLQYPNDPRDMNLK